MPVPLLALPLTALPVTGWALVVLALAAVVVGIGKTSFGGLGVVAVAVFALFLPTKESTATLLLLLIVGDLVAIVRYRAHVDRPMLRDLLPAVVPGIALGALFVWLVDDLVLKRTIGVLLILSVGLQLVLSRRRAPIDPGPLPRAAAWGTGAAAGFTTMTANAGGPPMALYLLAARVDKHRFVGTNAWFFFLVNVTKVPFSAALGLFNASNLLLVACLAPVVLLGTWIGSGVHSRVSQQVFNRVTLALSAVAALALIVH